VIIDAAKVLRSVVKKAFGERAAIQRCQWHKRENGVSYLPKGEQALWRRRLQRPASETLPVSRTTRRNSPLARIVSFVRFAIDQVQSMCMFADYRAFHQVMVRL
jgi:hypothetical protein